MNNTENNTEKNGFRSRFGESVIIKLILIGILTLVLLIPSGWVQTLISERQERQTEVVKEISDKWAGSQLLEGPVLILPYRTMVTQESNGRTSYKDVMTNIYILPDILNVNAKADPEILHRGIFDAVVYNTHVNVTGKFSELELKKSGIDPAKIVWDKAKVAIGISDLKGLKNNPEIKLSDTVYNVEPDFTSLRLFSNNLVILPDLSNNRKTALDFSFDLDLRGSTDLHFLHLGKNTTVKVEGGWNNPSFTGRYLPEHRSINKKAFTAIWKMPHFNRPFPQQWVEQQSTLKTPNNEGTFGVKFLLPVDQYQKTTRSAKYSILIILLTFLSLFFTELLTKRKVHFLQYVLIGAALIIYYTLLLSFSEQIGFNMAYLIASAATVVLIGTFLAALLKNKKPAIIFAGILSVFYGFIFIIIQLQDLALLIGSIGLFFIVSAMMYLSARIDWSRK